MRLKNLLIEASTPSIQNLTAEEFANLYAKAWYKNWRREVYRHAEKYPEVKELNYLFGQLENDVHAAAIQRGYIGFLFECIKNNRLTSKLASGQKNFENPGKREPEVEFQGEKCASFQGGCYYNALDFMKRTERDDAELAYGLMVEGRFLDKVDKAVEAPLDGKNTNLNSELTEHSFVLIGGEKVFDPSFPHSELRGLEQTYAYEIVPPSKWKQFSHDFDDKDYTAREFAEYIEKQLEKHKGKLRIKERIKKLHEKNKEA